MYYVAHQDKLFLFLLSLIQKYCTVYVVGIPPKVVHASKTAVHLMNILCKEKHFHGIVLVLPKPNMAFKMNKWLPNVKY